MSEEGLDSEVGQQRQEPASQSFESTGLMRVLDAGHTYTVTDLDGPLGAEQTIQFVKREGLGYPGNVGHYSGTTCQELLRVLIDRVKYLDGQIDCDHNKLVIDKLTQALYAFEVRAAGRHDRVAPSLNDVLTKPPCLKCGHVGCSCK